MLADHNGLVMHQPVTYVRTRRPGPAPRPGFVTGCAVLAGLGFGVAVGTVVISESRGSLAAPGGLLTAAGRLAGFTGAYLMLIMVVLVARLPWLEVSVGQDRLIRWHRRVAPWAFGLIAAHVVLITLGYAQAAQVGVLRQLWVFVTSYPDLLAAIAGFGLLVDGRGHLGQARPAPAASTRPGGSSTSTSTWGSRSRSPTRSSPVSRLSVTRSPGRSGSWCGRAPRGWSSCSGSRQPIWRSVRHQLRVVEVRDEAPGVVSVICRAGGSTGWRCREASSSCGASSPGTCGGRRTRIRCPRCRSPRTSG